MVDDSNCLVFSRPGWRRTHDEFQRLVTERSKLEVCAEGNVDARSGTKLRDRFAVAQFSPDFRVAGKDVPDLGDTPMGNGE